MSEFGLVHWMVVGVIVWAIYRAFSPKRSSQEMYCKSCGHIERAPLKTRGHFMLELVLWLCFIVPGLIYSIWRQTSKVHECSNCHSRDLVPSSSPIAVAAIRNLRDASPGSPAAVTRTSWD